MNIRYQQSVNRIINHISQNPDQNFSLAELAKLGNFSKYHLHRLFKAITGETIHQLVKRKRLEKAAELLIYDQYQSITTIALQCGFSSSANFTKAFSQHFACPPSQYRNRPNRHLEVSKIGKAKASPIGDTEITASRIDIQNIETLTVAYIRSQGEYQAKKIQIMFERLHSWLQQHQTSAAGVAILVNWSDTSITDQDHWQYDACLPITSDWPTSEDIHIQTLEGGPTAMLSCWLRPEQFDKRLQGYWDYLLGQWLTQSEFIPDNRPSYERFGDFNSAGQQEVTLCLPITTSL